LRLVDINNELFRRGERSNEKQIYGFSHLSEEDFAKNYLGLLPMYGYDRRRAALDISVCSNVPETKDWRELGKVPRVKSQMECGSCYIFSATAALESAIAIEYGIDPPMLSRQHLLNCITDPDTGSPNGCSAGRPEWVWKFVRDEGGLVAEKDEPYTGVPGPCKRNLPKTPVSEIDYWEKVPFRGSAEEVEEQIKCRLATTGPFHIGMTVRKNDMGSFKSGVYKNTDGICETSENVNHGLLLVGYGEKLLEGDRRPTKYWIIQNSWGELVGRRRLFER
jgi:C1A family cysteine protease